ncbi:MAG: hypothetical protein LW635_15060 [Microcystis sp. 53598_E5]|nr:hypothetical protein [Microcystis sp. 53598_E5]
MHYGLCQRWASCEDVKVRFGAGLHGKSAADLMATGQSAELAAAEHKIPESVTNMGMFVLIWRITEAICATAYTYALKMIATG